MIPYGKQDIDEADIAAVIKVLRSDFLTQGPAVPRFEELVAGYCRAEFAVAVNSATSALHIACLALGLGHGDVLWTVPNTFVASANCALYCGASVDFVDIDPSTYNLSVADLRVKLDRAEQEGRLPKVVVPVHFGGQSCEMREISALADRYGFRIIEDASHAVGGRYMGLPVGNCSYSDITIFSFHPVKIVTTAEGGMALTNDTTLAERMRLLRSHGITRDATQMTGESDGAWYYQQVELGFNYRLTDVQAALGASQMRRLDEFVERRHEIAARYNAALRGLSVVVPWQHPETHSAFHLYPVRVLRDRQIVFDALRAEGIGVNVHYIPVHTQPYYQKLGFKAGDFPLAEQFYAEAISLPMYPTLTEAEQDLVVRVLRRQLT